MTESLKSRRVLVTGAARGMGKAIALAFARAGAELTLLGRTAESLAATLDALERAGATARSIACDLRRPEAISAALDQAGTPDVLVNNAGIAGAEMPFLDLTAAEWHEVLAVNLHAPFLLSQHVARAMVRDGRSGVILHNASIAASAVDGAYAAYSVSKAGLLALMRSMAVELAPHRIRVNAVSPGYTQTEMTTSLFTEDQQEFLTTGFLRAPIRRIVTAEEVAQAFVFLASDAASGITGTNLVVDGGLTANLYVMETLPMR